MENGQGPETAARTRGTLKDCAEGRHDYDLGDGQSLTPETKCVRCDLSAGDAVREHALPNLPPGVSLPPPPAVRIEKTR